MLKKTIFLAYKKAKGVGNVLLRKAKNNIFKTFSPKRTIPNKEFLAYSEKERERERIHPSTSQYKTNRR